MLLRLFNACQHFAFAIGGYHKGHQFLPLIQGDDRNKIIPYLFLGTRILLNLEEDLTAHWVKIVVH